MMSHDQEPLSPIDQATRKRLARLGSIPVDTTRVERRLTQAMPTQAETGRTHFRFHSWARAAGALAAVLAIAATVTFTLLGGSSTVVASPIELGQLHQDILAGRLELTAVASIEQANRALNAQRRGAPQIPGIEDCQVQSCCLTDMQGKLVAIAQMDYQGQPITLVVASGRDFAQPMGQTITIDSRAFFAHQLNGLQMVMGNQGDLWLCVMGDLPVESLAQVAAGIRLAD